MAKAKKYTYNGSKYTMRELAEIFSLSYCRMSNLMKQFKCNVKMVEGSRKYNSKTGKQAKTFTIGEEELTISEISERSGYSKAAISGKMKRGIEGLALLERKGTVTAKKKKANAGTGKQINTVKVDKKLISRPKKDYSNSVGVTNIIDRLQVRNAVDDFCAKGGTIKKVEADGSIEGHSWKAQAQKSWNKRISKQKQAGTGNSITSNKSVGVDEFIANLEAERDQRQAARELLSLDGIVDSGDELADVRSGLDKGIVLTEIS